MKILYITSAWMSFRDVLYNGKEDSNGMPAFENVLKKLINKGYEIDMLVYNLFQEDFKKQLNIKSTWLKKINIIRVENIETRNGILKPVYMINGFYKIYKATKDILKENKYDFIYGHGALADAASLVARKYEIPFGSRRYGETLWDLIEKKGYMYAFFSHIEQIIGYKIKKSFLIATNDGSNMDKCYDKICKNKNNYRFYHLVNGVDTINLTLDEKIKICSDITKGRQYILYVARITNWKRQDLAVQLVYYLMKNNVDIDLLLIGQSDSNGYLEKIKDIAAKLGVSERVKYLGIKNKKEIYALAENACANLFFYDVCNLGNVFHETLSVGGIVIGKNDGSLDKFIINNENGFLINNIQESVLIIKKLISNKEYYNEIKKRAIETSKMKMLSWDDRSNIELEIIKNAITAKG